MVPRLEAPGKAPPWAASTYEGFVLFLAAPAWQWFSSNGCQVTSLGGRARRSQVCSRKCPPSCQGCLSNQGADMALTALALRRRSLSRKAHAS